MKKWMIFGICCLMTLLGAGRLSAVPEGTSLSVQGYLVLASDQVSGVDASIKAFESQLRSVFRFSGYRVIGRGTGTLRVSGETALAVGQGFRVELRCQASSTNSIPLEIKWMRGDKVLIHTRQTLPAENPVVVLGGPSHDTGVLMLLLTAK